MGLVLSEEQRMLSESARELFDEMAPVSALRKLRDEKDPLGYSPELWQQMAQLGWTGMILPESVGGSAFGFQGLGIALEQAGRTLAATPMLSTLVLGATLVESLGNPAQRERLLPAVVEGRCLLALAIDELPRHRPQLIRTRAERDGDGFALSGSKCFVMDGHVADWLLVVARSAGADEDPTGLSVFLVEPASAGLSITRTVMVDSRNAANLRLDSVRVGADALLGPAGGAGPALERALDRGRVGLAAEMLGAAQEAFDRTLAYLRMREQFGVPIGAFQALKHRAALMFAELELTRSTVYEALGALEDERDDAALLSSLAKAQACKCMDLVSSEAIQMHGGIGMTDDEEIGFFLKRARVAQQALGDAIFHRDRYARLRGF
ncbi:MAG: acyl-CoA dehydrogenase family protein [Gammaproteobacteria bacterium]|nr:acyl-CoA dehydrogenase family protein [Gammaproteobacteria bacterium]